MSSFVNLIIDISHEKVDRAFTYAVPDALSENVTIGTAVKVPFGQGNHIRTGYVTEVFSSYDAVPALHGKKLPLSSIKEIQGIATDDLPAEAVFVRLAAWMKRTYGATMIASLRTVLPVSRKERAKVRRFLKLNLPVHEAREYCFACERKNQRAKVRLLKELLAYPDEQIPYEFITEKLRVPAQTIRGLKETGIIREVDETVYRNYAVRAEKAAATVTLSAEQSAISDAVLKDFDEGNKGVYCLHGVTGSGKTEVYIDMIHQVVDRGYQAIVLIPEIALTYQTLMRFYRHFGERVSVVNSTLSKGEKYDQFERARNGEIDIIIGPRSALFTPFSRVGLIIIDEEHEPTYKSETAPKYHARDVAIAYAGMLPEKASVVLGSATPSLETYYKAMQGEYRLFTLQHRLGGGTLPKTEIVDLRKELKEGNRSVFSRALKEKMAERLQRKEQMMLFINRRGLAGFVSCRACGYVFKCPHCDVSLSEHKGGILRCHYCGHTQRASKICPDCGSNYVSAFRAGTQQIEREVSRLFPEAKVLRMDADTTRGKGSYEEILTAFAEHEADILVGTQMIVKGHDFPLVTLVGILAADMSLHAPDFHAAERTFQLLTQAAGRAGRGKTPGEVVIQTYQPEHYAVVASAAQDYRRFYDEEMRYRTLMQYPPGGHLMAVQVAGKDEAHLTRFANALRARMERMGVQGAVFIGPALAAVGKVNDIYRMVIYVKHSDARALCRIRDEIEFEAEASDKGGSYGGASIQFDLDPVRGY